MKATTRLTIAAGGIAALLGIGAATSFAQSLEGHDAEATISEAEWLKLSPGRQHGAGADGHDQRTREEHTAVGHGDHRGAQETAARHDHKDNHDKGEHVMLSEEEWLKQSVDDHDHDHAGGSHEGHAHN